VLHEYGVIVHNQSSLDTLTPLQAARKSIDDYKQELGEKDRYLSEFQNNIDRGLSNLNILIKAQEEFDALEHLSERFLQEVLRFGQKPSYPTHDLERIRELVRGIASHVRSAAGSVANSGNALPQITQIKRNLPMVQKILKQLLYWLEKMSAYYG
jgi:cell fate (sporulation/competence/biofilm development) regulator YlbF (YheA/YmcA/DUF963 family)